MAKAHSTPLNDIAIIAANLKDRYKNGFPVLKEIVQNADDAHATSLIMGWSSGLEGATHPLLADPALFFINNAPLSSEDVFGILSIGLGTKPGDDNAVGKFGLGMKSLFHLGEVFFYQSFDWQASPDKCDVFNPWDHLRSHWMQVSDQDKHLIEDEVRQIAPETSDSYFVVWVPLRSQSIYQARNDSDDFIITGEDYQRDIPDFIRDAGLADKLAGLLPLMKTLQTIEIKVKKQHDYQRLAYVALSSEASRPQFTRLQGVGQWQGAITVIRGETSSPRQKYYAGHEVLLNIPAFTALREHRTWPFSYSRQGIKTPDKALPHAAAVITAEKLADDTAGTLTLEWAVFLPLGEQDTAQHAQKITFPVQGQYAWHITLHGYFFIDAGRVGIQGLSTLTSALSLISDETMPTQDLLVQEWNRLLATQGTLPLLPQTICSLMSLIRAKEQDKAALAKGVCDVLHKNTGWLDWATLHHLWLCEMTPEGNRWKLTEANRKVRALPSPPHGEPQRPWEALPDLATLEPTHLFIDESKSSIYNWRQAAWQQSEIQPLVRTIPSQVISTPKLLQYVNQWLVNTLIDKDNYAAELVVLLKAMLHSIPLTELSANKTAISELVAKIRPTWRYHIAIDKQQQALWDAFRHIKMDTLLLPEFLDPKSEPANASLSWEVVGELLKAMQSRASVTNEFEKLVQALISGLSNIDDRQALYRRYDTLKIFTFNSPDRKKNLESRRRLLELKQMRRVFKLASGDSFGLSLSGPLQQALSQKEIALISHATNQTLFGGSDVSEAQECDYKGVLRLLALHPRLDAPAQRVNLLNKLAADADKFTPDEFLAFRYLMHGNEQDSGNDILWKAGKHNSVWTRLLRDATPEHAKWTIIDTDIEQNLALLPRVEKALKLDTVTPSRVIGYSQDGLTQLDYSWATEDDAEEILLQVGQLGDEHIWSQLPLHLVEGTNCLTAINKHCYLQKHSVTLPDNLLSQVLFIKPASNPSLQQVQQQAIPLLDEKNAILLALSQNEPQQYCQFILSQLTKLNVSDFNETSLEILRKIPWLVYAGKIIAPENVLDICAADCPDIAKLADVTPEIALFEDLKLSPETAQIISHLISTGKDAFHRALIVAGKQPEYLIGQTLPLTDEVLAQARDNQNIFSTFNGWRLLIACYNGAATLEGTDAVKVLSQRSSGVPTKIMASYQQLVEGIKPGECEALRKTLLTSLCYNQNEPLKLLRTLKLRTTAERWQTAAELCYGVAGIEQNALLHSSDWAYLSHWLRANDLDITQSEQSNHLAGVEQSAEVLQHYFATWERWVPRKAIAALLALLSGQQKVRQLCERYLESQSYPLFIDELRKNCTPLHQHADHFKDLGFEQCLAKYSFAIRIYDMDTLHVHSIFGEKLNVPLATDLDTLFVGSYGYAFYTGAAPQIFIRRFSPDQCSPQELLAILKRSTSKLMEGVYLLRARLDSLWQTFEQAEQLDVNIARVTILNSIVERLKTLGLKNSQLNELINAHDHELHLLAERSEGKELHSPALTTLVYQIADAIQQKETLRSEILAAVRKRIEDAQYQATSVPFELFQNADDAVEELHMLDPDTRNDDMYKNFVINTDAQALTFFNWGREINRFQSVKNEQVTLCHEGFKNDLKKMLALYQSDKEKGVTGKFGLGFKSCLLVTDTPYILSGRLATKITGGIIPETCDEKQFQQLNTLSVSVSNQGLNPTLIHLPLRAPHSSDNVLSEFVRYAGLLTIYARNLRNIRVGTQQWHWKPYDNRDIPGVMLGNVDLPNSKQQLTPVRVMVFQTEIDGTRSHFTFQLSRGGFKAFDPHIPSLWNLSPLLSETRLGFLLNTDFAVDIGRRQLAIDDQRNLGVIRHAGHKLHSLLEQLWLATQKDWDGFSRDWELKPELTQDQFWESVWKVISTGIRQDAQMSENEKLLQHLYHGNNGVMAFYQRHPALPNGFNGKAAALIKLSDHIRNADELVTRLANELQGLPAFDRLNADQHLVADSVGKKLKVTAQVTLETLLNESLPEIQGKNIQNLSPKDAEILSAVFTESFDDRLKAMYNLQDKVDAFRKQLGNLQVKTQSGTSRAIVKVVLSPKSGVEHLVSGFAPADVVIDKNYSNDACCFITWSRRRGQGYNIEELHEWAKRKDLANDSNKQQALCRFLIEAPDGEKLANLLMNGQTPQWLWELKQRPNEFPWQWSNKDIASLLNGRLLTDFDRQKAWDRDKRENPVQYTPLIAPEEAIQRIARWWQQNRHEELKQYNAKLYPEGDFDWESLKNPEDDARADMTWLKLLYLGSCQTIGRSREEQHRGAMDHFAKKGWWDTFVNPDAAPQWLEVMDEYLKDAVQGEKYRTWLQILPLYRFSKHLGSYRTLLDSSESFLDNIDDVLRPSSSRALSGTGITAPELHATLGSGINFIFRELTRNQVFSDKNIYQHCYSAPRRVRRLMQALDCSDIMVDQASPHDSTKMWEFFCRHLDEKAATFNLCFDIPLRILASNSDNDHKKGLRVEIFGQDPLDYYL